MTETTFGAAIRGSDSIHPQITHTNALMKLAATRGPEMILLSSVRTTVGTDTNMESAPTKLQNEAIRPVKKRARSAGSTTKVHA